MRTLVVLCTLGLDTHGKQTEAGQLLGLQRADLNMISQQDPRKMAAEKARQELQDKATEDAKTLKQPESEVAGQK